MLAAAKRETTPGVRPRGAALTRLVMVIPRWIQSLAITRAPDAVSNRPSPNLVQIPPSDGASDERTKASWDAASAEDYRQRQNNLGLVILLTVGTFGVAFAVVVILATT